ncbi:hypothetical protein BLNAU_16398 [Blattamonas nauphoetae]|uniref:Uncharacterized protein n=1 Tax=Blattamonas nauphoetae TaxID=2049346 RepID=A0ABQ9XDC1_9EUKA|nr:hypothetical protein BLNAU_16398 [Blattamonas nauphoetae]
MTAHSVWGPPASGSYPRFSHKLSPEDLDEDPYSHILDVQIEKCIFYEMLTGEFVSSLTALFVHFQTPLQDSVHACTTHVSFLSTLRQFPTSQLHPPQTVRTKSSRSHRHPWTSTLETSLLYCSLPCINPNALLLPWVEFIQLKTGAYNPQHHSTVPVHGLETQKINQASTSVEMRNDDRVAGSGWNVPPPMTTPTPTNNTLLHQTTNRRPEPTISSVRTTNRQNTTPTRKLSTVPQNSSTNQFTRRQERDTTGQDENGHGTGKQTVDDNQKWPERDQSPVDTQEAPRQSTPPAISLPQYVTPMEYMTEEGLEPTQPLPSGVNWDLPPLSDPAPEPLPQTSSPSFELVTEPSQLQQQPAQNRFRRKAAKKEEKVTMTCQYCGVAVEIDQMEEHVQNKHMGQTF